MNILGIDIAINNTGLVKFELDNDLTITSISWYGFTTVKKNVKPNIFLSRNSDYNDYIAKNIKCVDKIMEIADDCDYVAIEDYAFKATGKSFHIGEFTGLIKTSIYKICKKIRIYDIVQIKKYATSYGDADKIRMNDEFNRQNNPMIDLSKLSDYKSPKLDVIDAYYICDLLHKELLLRKGIIMLRSLPEHQIESFNRVTKKNNENILTRPFLCKESL